MEAIYTQHKKWINIAKTFGCDDDAEDLVQDTYIKALGREWVNEALFYFMLRDTIATYFKNKNRVVYYIEPVQVIKEDVYSYIDTWHPYDRKLYYTYINEKVSLRDLSELTGISLKSIFITIKNCNFKILQYLKENESIQYRVDDSYCTDLHTFDEECWSEYKN